MVKKEETLIHKLYFIRSAVDKILQYIPEDKRKEVISQETLQKLDDNFEDLVINLVDYQDMLGEIADAEAQEQLRNENNNLAATEFGENYNRLITEVNEKFKNENESLGVYIGRRPDKSVFLEIIDEINQKIVRVYDDKYDLAVNIEKDLATKFSCPKIDFNGPKLDLKNKKNNKE